MNGMNTPHTGGEFNWKNEYLSQLAEKFHLVVYYASGATKNAIVGMLVCLNLTKVPINNLERWNRTLKTRIERYFTETNTNRWVDILEDFTNNLNHSKNRTINMRPANVTIENAPKIFKKLHPDMRQPKQCKLSVGDMVRLAVEGNIFTKVITYYCTLFYNFF